MKFQIPLFSLLVLLVHLPSLASIPKIGYGSSNAVYPARNQEFFYMGYDLAMKSTGATKKASTDTMQITDAKALGAVRSANTLIARNPNLLALVGFPTSHEALLASKVAINKDLFFLSAAGSHSSLATLGPNIYTLGEALQSSQHALLRYVSEKFPEQKGLVITNPKATFSLNQEKLLRSYLSAYAKVDLELTSLTDKKELDKTTIKKLVDGAYNYIILTTYADDSTLVFKQLVANNINLNIYTNPSWIVGDIEFVRRLMIAYAGKIQCISSVIKGPESKEFEKLATKTYGAEPATEMYYGYDAGTIISQVLQRIEGEITPQSFKAAFLKNPCFEKTTSGTLCFPKKGGHAFRSTHLLSFNKIQGFVPTRKLNTRSEKSE